MNGGDEHEKYYFYYQGCRRKMKDFLTVKVCGVLSRHVKKMSAEMVYDGSQKNISFKWNLKTHCFLLQLQ